MKAKEYIQQKYPDTKWSTIAYLIQTKEGHWILIGVFAFLFFVVTAIAVILILNPELALQISKWLFNGKT